MVQFCTCISVTPCINSSNKALMNFLPFCILERLLGIFSETRTNMAELDWR